MSQSLAHGGTGPVNETAQGRRSFKRGYSDNLSSCASNVDSDFQANEYTPRSISKDSMLMVQMNQNQRPIRLNGVTTTLPPPGLSDENHTAGAATVKKRNLKNSRSDNVAELDMSFILDEENSENGNDMLGPIPHILQKTSAPSFTLNSYKASNSTNNLNFPPTPKHTMSARHANNKKISLNREKNSDNSTNLMFPISYSVPTSPANKSLVKLNHLNHSQGSKEDLSPTTSMSFTLGRPSCQSFGIMGRTSIESVNEIYDNDGSKSSPNTVGKAFKNFKRTPGQDLSASVSNIYSSFNVSPAQSPNSSYAKIVHRNHNGSTSSTGPLNFNHRNSADLNLSIQTHTHNSNTAQCQVQDPAPSVSLPGPAKGILKRSQYLTHASTWDSFEGDENLADKTLLCYVENEVNKASVAELRFGTVLADIPSSVTHSEGTTVTAEGTNTNTTPTAVGSATAPGRALQIQKFAESELSNGDELVFKSLLLEAECLEVSESNRKPQLRFLGLKLAELLPATGKEWKYVKAAEAAIAQNSMSNIRLGPSSSIYSNFNGPLSRGNSPSITSTGGGPGVPGSGGGSVTRLSSGSGGLFQ